MLSKDMIKKRNGKRYRIDNEFIEYKFKNITINIPGFAKKIIADLIKKNIFPSRSEFIRFAMRDGVKKYKKILKILEQTEINLNEEKETSMEIISVNVVQDHKDEADYLVEKGLFPSRSEFVRESIIDLLMDIFQSPKSEIGKDTPVFKVVKVLDDYQRPKMDKKKWNNTFEEPPDNDFDIF